MFSFIISSTSWKIDSSSSGKIFSLINLSVTLSFKINNFSISEIIFSRFADLYLINKFIAELSILFQYFLEIIGYISLSELALNSSTLVAIFFNFL